MCSQNISLSIDPGQPIVIVFALNCDFCGEFRSRRNGLQAEVKGVHRFVCEPCCDRAGAGRYDHIFGRSDWTPLDLIFPEGETA